MTNFAKAEKFIAELLESDPERYRGVRRRMVKGAQIAVVAAKDFMADRCPTQASALSFTSILSLVPFMALAFSILKGLGVQNRLEPLLLQQVAAGSEMAVASIIQYINNTSMKSVGAVGLVSLIVTVILLFEAVEEAFNGIWGVRETRSVYRKFTDYMSVALVAPVLLLFATSITTTLESQSMVQWALAEPYLGQVVVSIFGLAPYLTTWMALVVFYLFIPNTKVRLRSAVIGAVIAGTVWQIAQWGYIHFQMGVTRYNAIYGTMALVPLIMVWIYTSWIIILFGGEVVWAHQTLRSCKRGLRMTPSHAMHEYLTLSIFQLIASRFVRGEPPRTVEELAEELDLPTHPVQDFVSFYMDQGFLVEGAGEPPVCLPAKDIDLITLQELMSVLRGYGGQGIPPGGVHEADDISDLLHRMDEGRNSALAGMSVRDLANLPPAIDKRSENRI